MLPLLRNRKLKPDPENMAFHGQETVKFYVLRVGRAIPCAPFRWGERPREPLPPIVYRESLIVNL